MGARPRGFTFKDGKLEEVNTKIITAIVTGEVVNHIPRSKTIEISGMSQANFYKAMHDPALFRVGQLHKIYEGLNVPEEARRFV